MTNTLSTEDLEQRVRDALFTVAETVTEDAVASPLARARRPRRSRRRWGIGVGLGVAAVPLALAASSVVHHGSEYVRPIPPERIVMSGSVDGSRYLLVESDRTDECGHLVTGVELVEERENLLGSEWNTSGYEYGEPVEKDCGYVNDTSRYLKDPALFTSGGTTVGDSFVWVFAVHPDVDAVRITSGDYTEDLEVYEVDGAGYAPFEIPDDLAEYTSELIIDGQVVPGSEQVREVPRQGR